MKLLFIAFLFSYSLVASEMPEKFTGLAYCIFKKGQAFGGANYVYGLKNALDEIGNETSRITSIAVFVNGKQHGPDISYFDYPNRKVRSIYNYKNGFKSGQCIEFSKTGEILISGYYKNDKIVNGTSKVLMLSAPNHAGISGIDGFKIFKYENGVHTGNIIKNGKDLHK